jgi:hypothetical protein
MRKSLYYLIAFEDGIEISLTVRDAEKTSFQKKEDFQELLPQLQSATKYAEGYALRFEIESAAQCTSVMRFLTELMKMRSAGAPKAGASKAGASKPRATKKVIPAK